MPTAGAPRISVVLPTRNGMPEVAPALDAILAQQCNEPFELYCIDTESTDGTWEEIEKRGVKRRRIARAEFQHGRTRNAAIAETTGDVVVCTVQDAVPADEHWLAALVEAVRSEPDAAGAYCRQVPRPGFNPFLKRRLENWSAGRTTRRVQRLAPGQRLADLAPLARLELCAFDDVGSAMRRDAWRQFPLPERRFGEDVAWGKSVIEAGHSIVFEPRAVTVHSHDDGAWEEFKRIYLDHANLFELFGVLTVPTFADARRNSRAQAGVYREILATLDVGPDERRRLAQFAARLAFAETFAQWLGARSIRKAPPRGVFRWIEKLAAGA